MIIEQVSEPGRPAAADAALPPCVRVVHPPLRVWVNVRTLLPKGPHDDYSSDPTGLELGYEVLGLLTEKIWRADGGWVGRVRILLRTRDGQSSFGPWTALVPSHLLRYHRRGSWRDTNGLGH